VHAGESANLEKAIEIKRRAQRCIQNGDLDGALAEYERLVAGEDSDPYNLVLLADLLFKKGETDEAGRRYLGAANAYEKAGLYKNAIAVCKKLMRLQLAPSQVFQRLGALHALDGLGTEASLYYQQHADQLVREEHYTDAAESLRLAFEASSENIKPLERLGEIQVMLEKNDDAVQTLMRAAEEYRRAGQMADAERCRRRAKQLDPSAVGAAIGDDALADVVAENSAPASLPVAAARAAPPPAEWADEAASEADTPARLEIEPTGHAPAGTRFEVTSEVDQLVDLEMSRSADSPAPARLEVDPAPPPDLHEPGHNGNGNELGIPRLGATVGASAPVNEAFAPAHEEEAAEYAIPRLDEEAPALHSTDADTFAAAPEDEVEIIHEIDADAEAEAEDPRHERIELQQRMPAPEPPARAAAARPAATPPPAKPAPPPVTRSPESPGLKFPAADAQPTTSLADVERMLSQAQECFRAGQREDASAALAGAARAYDVLGRFDSAATIYRSLGKSAHATNDVLELWLENCERRGDTGEAAQVACELGDRALNDGDTGAARKWFERAREFDPGNEVSLRRLQRMSGVGPPQGGAAGPPRPDSSGASGGDAGSARPGAPAKAAPGKAAAQPAAPVLAGGIEPGRVEVAVGRGEAVTFDLGSLISEFQRGVEAQLSGDAQSHYDLAMSYREMGLLEQAVDSFKVAADDPAYVARASEMIGHCMLDQGRFDEAIQEFERALSAGKLAPAEQLGLEYSIALSHEGAGRTREALDQFQRIYAVQPGFPDVEMKIRVLRKSLESA
jgi:tetratricopeptide (TPR) repeat protein